MFKRIPLTRQSSDSQRPSTATVETSHRSSHSARGEKKKYSRLRDRACETRAGEAGGFASSRLWAVTRRCFDIDLRIGQRRLSILMARDRDSARCEAHVLLMILVYRGIPSLAIYSHRRARTATYRIRVTRARCNMSRGNPGVGDQDAGVGGCLGGLRDGLAGFLMAKGLRGNTTAIKRRPYLFVFPPDILPRPACSTRPSSLYSFATQRYIVAPLCDQNPPARNPPKNLRALGPARVGLNITARVARRQTNQFARMI